MAAQAALERQLEVRGGAIIVLLGQILVARLSELAAANTGHNRQYTQQQPDSQDGSHNNGQVAGLLRVIGVALHIIGTMAQEL